MPLIRVGGGVSLPKRPLVTVTTGGREKKKLLKGKLTLSDSKLQMQGWVV